MKILIVGNGGREHTLLWRLREEEPGADFFATRPNAGMAPLVRPVDLDPGDVDELAAWADRERIDLTVVGPEAPLAAGIVDRFRARGLAAFGPTADAARIEASKAFAKELMKEAGVPTAAHVTLSDPDEAERQIRARGAPIVVKASGLAAGKGAIVCRTVEEAVEAARGMLEGGSFGEAGHRVVVEEYLEGEELSVLAITDGRRIALPVPAQDHKPIGEGDTGPNTGGMGAYAPVSVAGPTLLDEVREWILAPTLRALERKGSPFRGVLYAGLMLTADGPRVVEFNCRFGDPEAQVVLPLLDGSLLELLVRVAEGGELPDDGSLAARGAALTTVLASDGYPGSYEKGREIEISPEVEDDPRTLVFHAGTARREGDGALVTAGGRVLAVTGLGETLPEARERSLAGAERILFEGRYFRRDIGWRDLQRS